MFTRPCSPSGVRGLRLFVGATALLASLAACTPEVTTPPTSTTTTTASTTTTTTTTPVTPPHDNVRVATGWGASCAITASATVKCWGFNASGELGDGTTTNRIIPVEVVGVSGATEVSMGHDFSCALVAGGAAKCWGSNVGAQLGDGSLDEPTVAVDVVGVSGAVHIASGEYHSCALSTDGTMKCWGQGGAGQLGNGLHSDAATSAVDATEFSGVTQMALGRDDTCALINDGTIRCAGFNQHGAKGNGTVDTFTALATTVTGIGDATAIGAENEHVCAVVADGAVKCWGLNDQGQVGDGTTTDRPLPTTVNGLTGATGISAGRNNTCAVRSDGSLWCWGANGFGQGGNIAGALFPDSLPILAARPAAGVAGAVQASSGFLSTCFARSTGPVGCLGDNQVGSLGNGTTADAYLLPTDVVGL